MTVETRDYRGLLPQEIDEGEKRFVRSWLKLIEKRLESPEYRRLHKKIPVWRRYVRGEQGEQYDTEEYSTDELVLVNLIGPAIHNVVARIYARNPEVSVKPRRSVEPQRYELIRRFGETAMIVLSDQFKPGQANLKRRAKANVRAGLTTSLGWLKATYQRDIERDPIIQNRLQDAQDQLMRLRAEMDDLKEEERVGEAERKQEELRQQISALQEQAQVVRSEGLIIDRVLTENLILSGEVSDTDSYLQAEWIAERIYMPRSRIKQLFGFAPGKATIYNEHGKKQDGGQASMSEEVADLVEHLCIYEVWHRGGTRVYTFCEGYHGYLREPFTPQRVGERWYPYFGYAPLPVDGEFLPSCYVEQVLPLQDEYVETRTRLREHRRNHVPHWVGLKGAISSEDADKLRKSEPFEITLIDGEPGQNIRNYLDVMTQPPFDPQAYDTTETRVGFELVSGQGDAARGVVAKPKTLGEAEIVEQGLAVRMSDLQDAHEDLMQELAQYCLEILLQELTPEQVLRIAGPGAVWPNLSKDEIFDMVEIQIEAGSTGRPNQDKERQVWIELMPLLRDTVQLVHELRKNGQDDVADAMVEIFKEAMRRFDDRIDMERFFPPAEEEEGISPQRAQEMQAQQQAMQQQAELLSAQIAELKSRALKNIAEAEAKEVGEQFDRYMEQLRFLAGLMSPSPAQPTLQ